MAIPNFQAKSEAMHIKCQLSPVIRTQWEGPIEHDSENESSGNDEITKMKN